MSQPLTHSFPLLLPTVLLLLGIVFAGWLGWSVGVWVASLSATRPWAVSFLHWCIKGSTATK